MYKKGDKVTVTSDNENYNDFRGKILIVVNVSNKGRCYDESMYPQMLMDFETQEGDEIPYSLYEYEVMKF